MEEELKQKFDSWNLKKQRLEFSSRADKMYFKEGHVWWCSLGQNVGSESYGKGEDFRRPVLVLKKLSSDLCIVLPLTSKEKTGSWFTDIILQGEKKWVLLYQIRTLNKKRFSKKIGELDGTDFEKAKEKLKSLLESLPNRHPAGAEIEGNNPKSIHIIGGTGSDVK